MGVGGFGFFGAAAPAPPPAPGPVASLIFAAQPRLCCHIIVVWLKSQD